MKKIIFTLLMLFSLLQTFAQATVVIGGNEKGDDNATVQIVSQNGKKGFMPPRLTQVQINALQSSLALTNNGLTVFNTDEKCLQSWNGTSWTECNPVLIAKFETDCANSGIRGNYYKDVPVTNDEYLEISVVVKKAGSFTFAAETVNGVRFFYSSVFSQPSATPQTIKIPAYGKPTATGSFTYNLVDQSGASVCSGFSVDVIENNAIATIDCSGTKPSGEFIEGQEVGSLNTIQMTVYVTKTGNYEYKTEEKFGLSFYAKDSFKYPGQDYVTMRAKPGSIPTWNAPDGKIPFDIMDKDGNVVGSCSVIVPVSSKNADYDAVNCNNDLKVIGDYTKNKTLNSSLNYIELKLNIKKPGPYTFETETQNNFSFRISDTFDSAGLKTIRIPASGEPETDGTFNFTLRDLNTDTILCTVPVLVRASVGCFTPVSDVSTISLKQEGTWTAKVPLSGVSCSVTLRSANSGPFTIQANGYGITMSYSGVAPAAGNPMTINFAIEGTPDTSGTVQLILEDACGDITPINLTIGNAPGSKENPSKSCYDIYTATSGTAKDGEYWINPTNPGQAGAATGYVTLCDMTAGGYTLVWSFSEDTDYLKYDWENQVEFNPSLYRFNADSYYTAKKYYKNQSYPVTLGATVPYDEFKMSLKDMKALTSSNTASYKIRIASNGGKNNISDSNANSNYVTFQSESNADPRYDSFIKGLAGEGKIFGKAFSMTSSSGYGTGTYDGNSTAHKFQIVNNSNNALCLYWLGSPMVLSVDSKYTNIPATLFGGFDGDFTTTKGSQVNGHFQKCKNGLAACQSNGNQLRTGNNYVLQYFIK